MNSSDSEDEDMANGEAHGISHHHDQQQAIRLPPLDFQDERCVDGGRDESKVSNLMHGRFRS